MIYFVENAAIPAIAGNPFRKVLLIGRYMITREQILKIARLGKLKLSDAEVEDFTGQLGSILEFVEQLDRVDTGAVEPTCFMAPQHDPFRDDVEKPSLSPGETLRNGPKVKNGFFAIPKVIG